MAKKMTPKQDSAWDQAHGIKDGSRRDNALDRSRGVPTAKKGKK